MPVSHNSKCNLQLFLRVILGCRWKYFFLFGLGMLLYFNLLTVWAPQTSLDSIICQNIIKPYWAYILLISRQYDTSISLNISTLKNYENYVYRNMIIFNSVCFLSRNLKFLLIYYLKHHFELVGMKNIISFPFHSWKNWIKENNASNYPWLIEACM